MGQLQPFVQKSTQRPARCRCRPAGTENSIGPKGATIKRLKESTGCYANNPDKGAKWIVSGPNEIAVSEFMRLACQIVGGTTRIVESRQLRVLEKSAEGPKVKAKTRAKPPAKASRRSTSPKRKKSSQVNTQSSECFIATACYGDEAHSDVVALRRWRDEVLVRSRLGVWLAQTYYVLSPPVAEKLRLLPFLATAIRGMVLGRSHG